ncbi:MAG: GNAT family N-acetyltransferase [Planctomycetes bacterium]|nr:GNAT family N-acetyltransferase [Planctomycetota bacterium]
MSLPASSCPITHARPEDLVALRHAVLRPTLPIDSARFPGDLEPTTIHLCARADSVVVACASFMAIPFAGRDAYQLRGMATDPSIRGTGVGARLLAHGSGLVAARGIDLLWCNARCSAVGFYRKQGWTVVSPEFDIPTAGPHVKMTAEPRR